MFEKLLIYPAPQRVTSHDQTTPAAKLAEVVSRVDPDEVAQPQGYILTISDQGVTLVGHDDAGVFYGEQTIKQLRFAYPEKVPCVTIEDWPDIMTRGYMQDVSRDRVPTMETIKKLIDQLAALKINQFQLYTEHTVAYRGHESVWRDASPLTFDELAEIQAYCNERFIDLVPCQNVFGHMERWLKKPDYVRLAECPDGYDTPWGFRSPDPCSLNPADPESFTLSCDLIDQLASTSNSSLFNIGCDETMDLGQGKSKELCEREGKASVYLDYLQRLCARVESHGKTPIFFGDIILEHPELIEQLPKNAVLVNWNYENTKSFMDESKQFQEVGVRFYVCPGTSSWCTLTGRGQNTIDNLRDGAEAAVQCGAEGYLITDWGDNGHWQPYALSWIGLAYGAGVSWSLQNNRDTATLPQAISRLAVHEQNDVLGSILLELGMIHEQSEAKFMNSTWWYRYLENPTTTFDSEMWSKVSEEDARDALAGFESVSESLQRYQPSNTEAEKIKRELQWCVRIAHWTCVRVAEGLTARADSLESSGAKNSKATLSSFEEMLAEHQELWLSRCRPGGLPDSLKKLSKVLSLSHEPVGSR